MTIELICLSKDHLNLRDEDSEEEKNTNNGNNGNGNNGLAGDTTTK